MMESIYHCFWSLLSLKTHSMLMVLLLCLAFVSQAMASTVMAYHMIGMNGQEVSQSMSMMDHSHHNMMSEVSDNTKTSTDNCCSQTCSCFTGSCATIVALINDSTNTAVVNTSSKIFSLVTLLESQQSKSLYRPPILS